MLVRLVVLLHYSPFVVGAFGRLDRSDHLDHLHTRWFIPGLDGLLPHATCRAHTLRGPAFPQWFAPARSKLPYSLAGGMPYFHYGTRFYLTTCRTARMHTATYAAMPVTRFFAAGWIGYNAGLLQQ